MKDSKALHHLSEIAETYGKQASELKCLRQKVNRLTRQRDQAKARTHELRAQIAKYQKALAEARTELRRETSVSAWPMSAVHRIA